LLLLYATGSHGTFVQTVKDGSLMVHGGGRRWVGLHTSELMENVLSLYPTATMAEFADKSMINATVLRYLILDGDYKADVGHSFQLNQLLVLIVGPVTTPTTCEFHCHGCLSPAFF
jgi:hypothetical protein